MRPIWKSDILSAFSHHDAAPELVLYDSIDSTNKRALEYARENAPDSPVLFIASEQSEGRGRLGRSFISPMGGIYMTLLTRAPRAQDATALTAYTAVVLCRALEELTPLSPSIKWVNDIYIGDLKLAGILAQGAVDSGSGEITHVAVGIGLNVSGSELPAEIRGIATSLEREGCTVDRAMLAARITERFLEGMESVGSPKITEEYRRRSMLIGCEVNVLKPDCTYTARVTGIGDACELIIEKPGGEIELLKTGDVSVRKKSN